MNYILIILTSFSIGFLLTPIVIQVLHNFKLGDTPGGRKIHRKFTPSMGGIAFMVAAYISYATWVWQFPGVDNQFLLGAIALIFFVGLRDDMVELTARQKILGQLIAVILVVVAGDIRIKDFHGFLGINELPLTVSYLFSAFVLLVLTNAFNLIDGLDGLAGSISSISLFWLGSWFYIQGYGSLAVLSFSLLGGVLSFLVFNWHPAKIFMGDTGSLALGFALGGLIISFMDYNSELKDGTVLKFESSFTMGIVLMIYPLFDMARVFTKRLSKGKNPMSPDKSHVHHFLLRAGFKHNQVALILGLIQLILIVSVTASASFSDNWVLPILSAVVLFLGSGINLLTIKLLRRKISTSPKFSEVKSALPSKPINIKVKPQTIDSGNMNLN